MSAAPTLQDSAWLSHLVASSGTLNSEDLKRINRMIVEVEGRLPSAKQLPESLRDKVFPRRTLPVPPIEFPIRFPKRRV